MMDESVKPDGHTVRFRTKAHQSQQNDQLKRPRIAMLRHIWDKPETPN
jgi:hypothetical protein